MGMRCHGGGGYRNRQRAEDGRWGAGATGQGWKENGRVRTCDRWQTPKYRTLLYLTLAAFRLGKCRGGKEGTGSWI